MNGCAAHRGVDVFTAVAWCAADLFGVTVVDDLPVADLFADIDVSKQGGSCAIDIEFRIIARIAAIHDREFDELFPMRK